MNKLTLRLGLVGFLFVGLLIAGCGSNSTNTTEGTTGTTEDSSEQPAAQTDSEEKLEGGQIDFIVPSSPGGGFDQYARGLAPYIEKHFPGGAQVLVRNIGEGEGLVAAAQIYHAKPDGRTIGIWNIPGQTFGQLVQNGNFDLRNITWLGSVVNSVNIVVAGPNSGIKTFEDMKNKSEVVVATHGYSNPNFLSAVVVNKAVGINARYITGLEGTSNQVLAVMRGDADVLYVDPSAVSAQLENGDLVPLAYFGDKRLENLPDIPTIAEAGYPELVNASTLFRPIGAPPGMSDGAIQVWVETLNNALSDPEFLEWAKSSNRPIDPTTPEVTKQIVEQSFRDLEGILDEVKRYMNQ